MNTEELDKIRLDDIEFFARRYSELFGEYFDKNTSQEKEEFYEEIKEELLEKAPKYVLVDNDITHGAQEESYLDYIEFSKNSGAIERRAIRIHGLFHSYNHMGMKKHGLKDFDNELVLKNIDEGSTEMFAQMMCGNETKDTEYISEVKLTRFLTSIVGMRTMIRATRGNPKLLCESTDRLLGTQDFLQKLERLGYEKNKLISQSYGEDNFSGTPIRKDIEILSKLKLETIRGKDDISMFLDAIEQSGNQELYNNIFQVDNKFGYYVFLNRSIEADNKSETKQTTLADVQQDILKAEIEGLDKGEDISLQAALEIEIKKFLYDRISYQKHFLDHPEPKYDKYELTSEDTEFSENFRSDFDGASERLGGRIGLVGPGCTIYSLENTPHTINKDIVKNMNLPEISFEELQDFRLELWAEKLNIAQTRELLAEWEEWIYNVWYKEKFPYGEEETFREAIEGIKKDLEEKELGLVNKYKILESKKQKETVPKEENSSTIEEATEKESNQSTQYNVEDKIETIVEETQNEDKSLEVWTNRFSGWYGAMDKVSQNVKAKFVKMKSDIVKAISEKIKERNNKQEINKDQDRNER